MPRNRVSDDVDHVPADSEGSLLKNSKQKAPPPWPMLAFDAMAIKLPLTHGKAHLARNVRANRPYDVFKLLFTDGILDLIADATNEFAAGELRLIQEGETTSHARAWRPTNRHELRTYIGILIWMGLHQETSTKDFWRRDLALGPSHLVVVQHMGLSRFEQISRFFHISKASNATSESVFDKLEPLNEYLRQCMRRYWRIGTHLAVDESIARFMGRSGDIVNIPSKPTPEGYKVWCLSNGGYVLDWRWHSKKDGPIEISPCWTKGWGFSNTQAVVLEPLEQNYLGAVWSSTMPCVA